jgi:hypothetical protein
VGDGSRLVYNFLLVHKLNTNPGVAPTFIKDRFEDLVHKLELYDSRLEESDANGGDSRSIVTEMSPFLREYRKLSLYFTMEAAKCPGEIVDNHVEIRLRESDGKG